jgi:hypothetical protein
MTISGFGDDARREQEYQSTGGGQLPVMITGLPAHSVVSS